MSGTDGHIADTLSIKDFLEKFAGGTVYHPPLADDKGNLVGNNGDRLMVMGTARVYKALDISTTTDARKADLIVLGASGGMLDKFTHIPRLFNRLSHDYGDRPMCVLPSTFYYPNNPISKDIGERVAPLALFCREVYSFNHLKKDHKLPPYCNLFLDRDIAFELENEDYVNGVKSATGKHVLIVERVDVEHIDVALNSTGSQSMSLRKKVGKILPPRIKKVLYPCVTYLRSKQTTPFRNRCERIIQDKYSHQAALPRFVADISNTNTCTFEQFTQAISEAAIIFTTRLHVGILGAMAGKETYIFEGPYHKIRGIYEHSLARFENVTFVPLQKQVNG